MAMAIVLILVGTMLTGGKHLKVRAERQLTQSAIEVIVTAMEQYYEQTDPKQFPPQVNSQSELQTVLANTVTLSGSHPDSAAVIGKAYWSSETAFYFLEKVPQSKAILGSLAGRMLSNKDLTGAGLQMVIPAGGTTYDWVRFVDAWGTSLNYEYQNGDSFPVITSAGPDRVFGTEDDLKSQ